MKHRGFTLIEILVAIAIFTVVGILAMAGYNKLVQQSDLASERMHRVRAIQMAVLKLTQDFAELEPRPIREPIGVGVQPALTAGTRTDSLVALTRAGWANPAGVGRSTLQRVRYSVADGKLIREQFSTLDAVLDDQPLKVELLDNVRSVRFEFLDVQQQWAPEWPRAGTQLAFRARPLAARFTLELEDWGTITRVIEISNVTVN